MKNRTVFLSASILASASFPVLACEDHARELHFSHPLVAESPSPDTMARLRYDYMRAPPHGHHEEKTHMSYLTATMEYAFSKNLGVEMSVPYGWRNPDGDHESSHAFGNVGLGVKYASYALAEHGLLLGGGLETVLPTGDSPRHIGSDEEAEIAPFINFGWKPHEKIQIVGTMELGFISGGDEDSADHEVGWGLAFGYEATGQSLLLLELDGEKVWGGEEDGHNVVNLTPGVKFEPFGHKGLSFGAGIGFPLTDDREFDIRPTASVFYHF